MIFKKNIENVGLLSTKVWYGDAYGYPTDPVKAKFIAPKRKVANK